jgi:hypothetical protein
MRATLPLRSAPLRTPACPGFGVSGDRKRACFDRSCCQGAISAKRRLLGLPWGWDLADADGATHRERTPGWSFERVQMTVAGGRILEALAARRRQLPIERVQMGCGSEALRPWEPCPLGSFERVQIMPVVAVYGVRELSEHRGSHRQSQRHSGAAWPSRLPPLNAVSPTQIITGERLCHP